MTTTHIKRRTPWLDFEATPLITPADGQRSGSLPHDSTFHKSLLEAAERQSHTALRLEPPVSAQAFANSFEASSATIANPNAFSLPPAAAEVQAYQDDNSAASQKASLAKNAPASRNASLTQPKQKPKGAVAQLLSWAQSRCNITATKRLRIAEITSFGDKRFIALVTVGEREFLIGGGASGVSMLTPLQPENDSNLTLHPHLRDFGSSR